MIIYGAYIGYVAAAITIFVFRPARQAVLVATMLGWLLLPVAVYPPDTVSTRGLTMEIIGIALPSRLLLTKALVVATTVFVCLAIKAPALFARFRLTMPDVALGLFCLSPLLASAAGKVSIEQGLVQAAYLTGVWGCTWMTGRLALADEEGARGLVAAIMASGMCLLVPAVAEGMRPAWMYAAVYGQHPFMFNGVSRYLGFRPLAFFEDGNQYGMWISMAALVCLHGVLVRGMRSRGYLVLAGLLAIGAMASQSVSAILLLAFGCFGLLVSLRARHAIMAAAAVLAVTGGAAYLSGKVPLRSWARETASGQAVAKVLYMTNRASLGWRAQRDQKALPLIHQAPVVGHGTWDWWRPVGAHPWGLPLLIAGQFGLLAFVFAAFAILAAPLRDIWYGSRSVLPVIVVLAVLDSWLNSTAYLPAILVSAAIVVPFDGRSRSIGHDATSQAAATSGDPEEANA
jgi:hypothetical protein